MTWQHKVEQTWPGAESTILDEATRDHWELVAVVVVEDMAPKVRMYFKRPLPQDNGVYR